MALVERRPTSTLTLRRVGLVGAAAALGYAPYAVGVLLPYYANGLHHLPLAEVASGAHDPKDLWPHGPVAGLVQIAGLLSLLLTPLVVGGAGVVAAGGAVLGLARRPRAGWGVVLALTGVAALCALGVWTVVSPTGQALATWRLD